MTTFDAIFDRVAKDLHAELDRLVAQQARPVAPPPLLSAYGEVKRERAGKVVVEDALSALAAIVSQNDVRATRAGRNDEQRVRSLIAALLAIGSLATELSALLIAASTEPGSRKRALVIALMKE